MKKYKNCGKEIKDIAIKCKYCLTFKVDNNINYVSILAIAIFISCASIGLGYIIGIIKY